ncbi:HAD family hydrolase [Methylomonas sp. AM2-LC]|uniref:HAD family hydrolase n=1 Tax=Methylomonas sp. AM2-LC TaxID=3153301 RepID=UPI0032637FCE
MNDSVVYALDFDGVICDSAIETAISGWKSACQIWDDMPEAIPMDMIEHFRQVRPIIETGYEAILTMRLLYVGESIETIYQGYSQFFQTLMRDAQTNSTELKKIFGETRDNWIANDKQDWIEKNPLYSGVAEKLMQLNQSNTWYVITTKQERFTKKILYANQIELNEAHIFGLERNMSKPDILKMLFYRHSGQTMHFVEDRLPALLKVRELPELDTVKLSFASWGYNCAADKVQAKAHDFTYLTLHEFLV